MTAWHAISTTELINGFDITDLKNLRQKKWGEHELANVGWRLFNPATGLPLRLVPGRFVLEGYFASLRRSKRITSG